MARPRFSSPHIFGAPTRRPPRPADTTIPGFTPTLPTAPKLAAAAATPVDYGAQARQQVADILDPQLKDITSRFDAQAGRTSDAFNQLTSQYASRVAAAAAPTQGIFDQAIQPVSAAAKGINAQLTAAGAGAASTEQTAAAKAGLPTGSSPDIQLAAEGAGAGGAAGAIGQQAINSLQETQKAALSYAGTLPGFAKGLGDQQLHQTLSQIAGTMADQLATTTAQAPQLYYTIYQNLLDRAQTDKSFAEQVREFNANQKQQNRSQNLTTGLALWQAGAIDAKTFKKMTGVTPASATAPHKAAPLKIVHNADGSTVGVDAYTGQTVAQISGPGQPKPTKPTTFKGTDGRTYVLDPANGTASPIPGQSGPKPGSPGAKKGKQPGSVGQRDRARQYAAFAFYGHTDAANPANNSDPVDYQTAEQTMLKEGLPPKVVAWALNQYYTQPGKRGRPLTRGNGYGGSDAPALAPGALPGTVGVSFGG